MNSYIVEGLSDGANTARLGPEESRHAVTVMRLKPGDEIMLTNGAGRRFAAVAETCEANAVTLRVTGELPNNESPASVTVLIGCLKSDKLELLTQKLTEIGVAAIVPVKMARCVAIPDAGKKSDRLAKIAREAVKQSKRSLIPRVRSLADWKEALEIISRSGVAVMPWECAEGARMKDVNLSNPQARDITILVGPEGGITEKEAREAQAAGAKAVTLGPRILRSETAAMVSAALAQALWGDL